MKTWFLTAYIPAHVFCFGLNADDAEKIAAEITQAYEDAKIAAEAPVAKANEATRKKQEHIQSSAQSAAEAAFIAGQEDNPLVAKTPEERKELVKAIARKAAEAAYIAGQEDDLIAAEDAKEDLVQTEN